MAPLETTVLVTIHGSHLYGLAHAESDLDFFRVVEGKGRTKMRVDGGFDLTKMPLGTFLKHVFDGSHQSVEAAFSPVAWVHPQYRPMFNNMVVTGADVFARYRRTIHSFSHGDLKKRRHAVRLGLNLADLRRSGRFNPVLTDEQKQYVLNFAEHYEGDELFDIASNF